MKVTNFENIGKIITKAQELKMTINNDFYYSVSDKNKEELMSQAEANNYNARSKILNKGQSQKFIAIDVEIQAPSEYEIKLTITGNFEIIQNIAKQ